MSHGITATDNMFSVRELPWHRLVQPLEDYPTREEAQKLAHPWEPIEQPVYRAVPSVHPITGELSTAYEELTGSKGIERSDNGDHLGVVSDTRGLITNTEMWDVAEAIAKTDGDVRYETAGSLDGGKRVWILVRLTEPLQIKGDPNGGTLAYFALQNHLTATGSFRGQGINTRIVCANTSGAADVEAKNSGYEFRFKHSSKVSERIEEAKASVAMWRAGIDQWQTAMEHLVTMPVTVEQRELFVTEFHPMPPSQLISDRVKNNVETARTQLRSILGGETSEGVDLTAYGLAQAGIEWSQHYRKSKGSDEKARMESHFKRAMLSTDRVGADTIRLAREVALHA